MIKQIRVVNYVGEEVTVVLNEAEPEHGLIITEIEGLGPPKANINATTLATTDGSVYNSARSDPRNIVISFLFTFAPTIEDSRLRTYKYFPLKKPLDFFIETDNRQARAKGYVESNEPDIFSSEESNQISIVCDDPYFYSEATNTTVFYGVEPLFEFEFSDPEDPDDESPALEFSSIENEKEKTVYYDGDAEVGITITIHALDDARNITIYNARTREVMRIDTSKIPGRYMKTHDDIIINTTRGNHTIRHLRDGIYTNILNALDKYSDWFQLARGDNVFAYTAEEGEDDLQFMIENQVVYWGV